MTPIDIKPEYTEEAFVWSNRLFPGARRYWFSRRFTTARTAPTIPLKSISDLSRPPAALSSLAIINDITERKRAEEERRKLERRFQTAQKMESVGTLAGNCPRLQQRVDRDHRIREILKRRIANDPKAISDLDEILRQCGTGVGAHPTSSTFARRQIIESGTTST